MFAVKEGTDADLTAGFPGFEDRHGVHGEPSKSSGPGMEDVTAVSWYGRTGQDELPCCLAAINFSSDLIPKGWDHLPFVD